MLCANFCRNQCNRLGGVNKSMFATFCEYVEKNLSAEMGVAYIRRFSTIQ